jgi:excisionase family DNA binding protein
MSGADGPEPHLRHVEGPTIKLLLTIPEVAAALAINRSTVYELLLRGELGSVKIGRARRIPVQALERWIEEHTEAA